MRGCDRYRACGGEEVDRLNIYWAAMEARRRAVDVLPIGPAHILVDDKRRIAGCQVAQTPVVDGDALNASIAAASIVAKVSRDSIMEEYAQLYPGYGFERHKGYGTADHISALRRLGPLSLHRWSFCASVEGWQRTTTACLVDDQRQSRSRLMWTSPMENAASKRAPAFSASRALAASPVTTMPFQCGRTSEFCPGPQRFVRGPGNDVL